MTTIKLWPLWIKIKLNTYSSAKNTTIQHEGNLLKPVNNACATFLEVSKRKWIHWLNQEAEIWSIIYDWNDYPYYVDAI